MPLSISTGSVPVPVYMSPLVVAEGGYLYVGYPYGVITKAAGQPTPPLRDNVLVSMCFLNRTIFAVDGLNITTLPLATMTVTAYAATEGVAPTNCFLCCNWRGRLLLAGDRDNPQNFYAARTGVPTDWDFGKLDPAAAFAGNLSRSGQIGEPIVCLIPYSDDIVLIGCTNSLWMIQGDPADGGTIVPVSEQLGIIGPNAWTIDPNGVLYFIARGGLYTFKPSVEQAGAPQLLTGDTYDQYFRDLVDGSFYVSMQWDVDAKYMHIFATPTDRETAGVHLIMDQRNGGLWPQQYPGYCGPTATARYAANNITKGRAVLLGGTDGVIRQFTALTLSDDGQMIESYCVLGPVKPQPEAAIFSAVTIDYGETTVSDTNAAPVQLNGLAGVDMGGAFVWLIDYTDFAGAPIDGTVQVFVNGEFLDPSLYDSYSIGNVNLYVITNSPVVGTLTVNMAVFGNTATPWNAVATIRGGPDAFSVTEGTPHSKATIYSSLDRRQKVFRQRFRAGWFSLVVGNSQLNTYFSFESAVLEFSDGGRNRERR